MQSQWRRWHRRLGALAAVFVLIIVATGLLLNHTERLSLDQRYVSFAPLLSLYNITLPEDFPAFAAGDLWFAQLGDRVYVNGTLLADTVSPLVGAAPLGREVVLAARDRVWVVDREGALLEQVNDPPFPIESLGALPGGLAVRSASGVYRWELDSDRLQPVPDQAVQWSEPSIPPRPVRSALAGAYRGRGLSVERIVLDLHSGRVAGRPGTLFVDAVALVFMVLALTGFWLWWKGRA